MLHVDEFVGHQDFGPPAHGIHESVAAGFSAPQREIGIRKQGHGFPVGLLDGIAQHDLDGLGVFVAHQFHDLGVDALHARSHILGPICEHRRIVDAVMSGLDGAPIGVGSLLGRCCNHGDSGKHGESETLKARHAKTSQSGLVIIHAFFDRMNELCQGTHIPNRHGERVLAETEE